MIIDCKIGARYWEDATVNGVVDTDGTLIPLREGDYWHIIIDANTGKIQNWPEGTTADVRYKVCDDGEYCITGHDFVVSRYGYVPDFLSIDDNGYGDYINMEIEADGTITDWKAPEIVVIKKILINGEEW